MMPDDPQPERIDATAYRIGRDRVVLIGRPDNEDERPEGYHNCDYMGCGQTHVLGRAILLKADGDPEGWNRSQAMLRVLKRVHAVNEPDLPPSIPGPVVDLMEEVADCLDLWHELAVNGNPTAKKLARDLRAAAQPGRAAQLLRELAAEKEELVMCEPAVAAELYRQLTEALAPALSVDPARDDFLHRLSAQGRAYFLAPGLLESLRADAVDVHADLTKALFPFGPAGEVPTDDGHYDIANGDVIRSASLYSGKWRVHELRHSDILTSATMTKMAAVTDHFAGLRFAVRPTRKPPSETP